MAASAPEGNWIEIGTSAGYSALWLSLACRERHATLTTYEVLSSKAAMARANVLRAGAADVVHVVEDDFRSTNMTFRDVSFCFLDAEKDVYEACFDLVVPRMVTGGLLIADNVISHQQELQPFIEKALGDSRLDATIVPLGKGELVCRKL
jgi:predicted O-methyltransferase YrrM